MWETLRWHIFDEYYLVLLCRLMCRLICRRILILSCLACLLSGVRVCAGDNPAESAKYLEKAWEISDIRAVGMPVFRMEGKIRIWGKEDAPAEGKYLLIWTPVGKWREEIAFNGYSRVRVGEDHQFWQVRSSDFEYRSIFDLENTLDFRQYLRIQEGDKFSKAHREKISGAEVDCVKSLSSRGEMRTLCFDSTMGTLVRVDMDGDSSQGPSRVGSKEYSQFQNWAGKSYPRTLRDFNGKQLVVEVLLDEIKTLPDIPPSLFAVPKDATRWAHCPNDPKIKIKTRVQPQYPPPARTSRMQGTVAFYAQIEEDGKVSHLHVLNSAGAVLDQAAAQGVSQWVYEPPVCAGVPGRVETMIDVIFSLH